MSEVDSAVTCFKDGFSCSQAVFSVYAEQLGLDRETALRIATGFGGGMARTGQTCGAVTGALMALGLKYGKSQVGDEAAKDKTYELVGVFVERFRALHGSINCNELLGNDIGTPEGREAAREAGLFDDLCPLLVRDAAIIVGELL